MSTIYLAGPIDYGTNDGKDRQKFIADLGSNSVVYDATTTFVAPSVDDMSKKDMHGAISIHHAAVEACDVFVADMRNRSVGIPIEMWVAHSHYKPIFTLYDRSLPTSIYVEYMTDTYAYSWAEMTGIVAEEISGISLARN